MKIVGQSTLANGSPYLHLGYLAATYTYTRPNARLFDGGLVVLAIGILMGGSALVGWVAAKGTALDALRRNAKKLLVSAVVFILLGVIALKLSMSYGTKVEVAAHPEMMTQSNAHLLLRAAAELQSSGEPVPTDPAAVGVLVDDPRDGWLRPMRLVRTGDDGQDDHVVVSAGPDGEFGSEDDVHWAMDPDRDGVIVVDGPSEQ